MKNMFLVNSLAALAFTCAAASAAGVGYTSDASTAANAAMEGAVVHPAYPMRLGHLVYIATDTLLSRLRVSVAKDRPVIVTTIANTNNLEHTNGLGRLVSQLVVSRLAQQQYAVRDLNYTGSLEIRSRTGEMILSRDISKLSRKMNAQAIVVGSYAQYGDRVYVTLRMLEPESGVILSSVDFVVMNDADLPLAQAPIQ